MTKKVHRKVSTAVAVRRSVIIEMYGDPLWASRLDRAKNLEELIDVMRAYCKAKSYRIIDVPLEKEVIP